MHAGLTHRLLRQPHRGEIAAILLLPSPAHAGEEETRVAVPHPPLPQLLKHLRRDGHLAVLAAFAIDHTQHAALRVEMRDLQSAHLSQSQATMIHEREHRTKPRLFDRGEQDADFFTREHGGQSLRALDADLLPARPVRVAEVIAEEQPQAAHALIERAALATVVLLEMMKEGKHLLF